MPPPIPPDPQLWGSFALRLQDMFARSLASLVTLFFALSALPGLALPNIKGSRGPDACAAVAGQKWVSTSHARACLTSFQVDPVEKANVGANYSLSDPFFAS